VGMVGWCLAFESCGPCAVLQSASQSLQHPTHNAQPHPTAPQVMLPPNARGTISYIAPSGHYTVNDEVIEIEFQGQKRKYSMKQLWPVGWVLRGLRGSGFRGAVGLEGCIRACFQGVQHSQGWCSRAACAVCVSISLMQSHAAPSAPRPPPGPLPPPRGPEAARRHPAADGAARAGRPLPGRAGRCVGAARWGLLA
jgi:hypothetical protein